MHALRTLFAAAVAVTLATVPAFAGPGNTVLGTVITAEKAHVGEGAAAIGTTVYAGDHLSTENAGSVQLRAGAARLLLLSASAAEINDSEGAPSAKLLLGTATFSTGNAHAFTLYASKAAIRAQSDAPTIGQVTYLNAKELLVTSKRGPLTITVDGETQLIADGTAYHVYLDPEADPQNPQGAGSGSQGGGGRGGSPLKAGRSRFLIFAVGVTGVATYFAVSEALESPHRP
ncbi:MAG TPA: hypothetical protein VGH37_11170 [Candidatus Acidoferrum sp.]|jgi:hypothetical protein